jgi:eukaryotic-like serine/threonine-protein kinase
VLAAREKLAARFGSISVLGHLRFLCVDTVSDLMRQANQSSTGLSLTNNELIITRLNRPSYYLRNREDRDGLDQWLDSQMLYRIPRTLGTGGIRALGRLAFSDHFAAISRAIREALEQCTEQETLLRASRETQLGMRSNRPRVYVVCSLMGGTGGGMFIDTAYLVRCILRQLGYESAEVIGIFLLPEVDRGSTKTRGLGNAYTALRELTHFSLPSSVFHAKYGEKDEAMREQGAPFVRSFLLEMPDAAKVQAGQQIIELGGEFLARELVDPMGRSADFSRAVLPGALQPAAGPICHAFGMDRFAFPRSQFVQEGARSICRRFLDRWISKNTKPLEAGVEAKVNEKWAASEWGTEGMLGQLLTGCEKLLQNNPDTLLAGLRGPIVTSLKQFEAKALALSKQKDTGEALTLDLSPLEGLVVQIEGLLGKPLEDGMGDGPPVPTALARTAEDVVADVGQKLAEFVVGMIEQPEFRLAGAEEAVRQFISLIDKGLTHHEPFCKDFVDKSANAHRHLHGLVGQLQKQLSAGRKGLSFAAGTARELSELLQTYPKMRYQSLVLQQFSAVYVSMRGNLSDLLHEINNCRMQLVNLRTTFGPEKYFFEDPQGGSRPKIVVLPPVPSRGTEAESQRADASERKMCHSVFPQRCTDFDSAVRRFLNDLTADDVRQLEESVQGALTSKFGGLVNVCLASASALSALETLMQTEIEHALDARLTGIDVGQLFLEQYPEEATAGGQLAASFERAQPALAQRSGDESQIAVLGVPRSAAGDRLREICVEQVGKHKFVAIHSEDISFYRENCFIKLSDLEQFGPLAQEAYRQLLGIEHFTPHTRIDIETWETTSHSSAPALQHN